MSRNKKKILFTSHTANFQKFNHPLMKMLRGTLQVPYDKYNDEDEKPVNKSQKKKK